MGGGRKPKVVGVCEQSRMSEVEGNVLFKKKLVLLSRGFLSQEETAGWALI